MSTDIATHRPYLLGHAEPELDRLIHQADYYADLTAQAISAAGIGPGMRVLDVGCGAGDVTLLLARQVGPTGDVIAIDSSPDAIARASSRVEQLGLRNVHFLVDDMETFTLDAPVDAVVGRLVLMYARRPAAVLQNLAKQVAPGGILLFQENDLDGCAAEPPVPLVSTMIDHVREAFRRAGLPVRPGLRLHEWFVSAGLPAPSLQLVGKVEPAPARNSIALLVGVVRTLLPIMEQLGVASANDIGIETLEERLLAEMQAANGIAIVPPLVAAWTRI